LGWHSALSLAIGHSLFLGVVFLEQGCIPLNVGDFYFTGRRSFLRLNEKSGKDYEVPAHLKLEEYLDCYLESAGLSKQKKVPLFQSADGQTPLQTGWDLGNILVSYVLGYWDNCLFKFRWYLRESSANCGACVDFNHKAV
jgi:hypothetical protein